MDVITESGKVVKVRKSNSKSKRMFIRRCPGTQSCLLLLIDEENRDVEPIVVGEFRTVEDAEKANTSIGEAIVADTVPWDVNDFKKSLYG